MNSILLNNLTLLLSRRFNRNTLFSYLDFRPVFAVLSSLAADSLVTDDGRSQDPRGPLTREQEPLVRRAHNVQEGLKRRGSTQ